MHDLRMIHTDLKPENILLVSPDYVKVPDYRVCYVFISVLITDGLSFKITELILLNYIFYDNQSSSRSPSSYSKRVPKSSAIKVIDFGSTTYEREDQTYIVSTRHYRAPEVILGIY